MNEPIQAPWNLTVTDYCIKRFRERSGNSTVSDMSAANQIRNLVYQGKEYEIKDPVKRVRQLLTHDLKGSRYFKCGKLMVVVQDRTTVTVHEGTDPKWTPIHETQGIAH